MTNDTDTKLPAIQGGNAYEGKYFDRSPQCIPAGILTYYGESTEECLHVKDDRPPSPDVIRKFQTSCNPNVGQMRIFYGNAYDPQRQWAAEMTHGMKTQQLLSAKEIVNPEAKTQFKQQLFDRQESTYMSNKKAPLGRSHDQSPGLPEGLDPLKTSFGLPIQISIGAGALVNPNKTYEQVFQEASEGHELYVRSHADYYPLERVCRNYTSPNFHFQKRFGLPTFHCEDGKKTKVSLKLFQETQDDVATKLVSKRLEDYRERYQHQIGKPLDPIRDTMKIPEDYTFGAVHKPDPFGAGDVIHNRGIDNIQKGKENQRAVVTAMRQKLKKLNYQHFNNLLEAFRFYDENNKGKITLSNLRNVCIKYKLPVDLDILEKVLDYCDADKDGMINYLEFCNFLNWKDKMPTGLDDLGLPPVLVGQNVDFAGTASQNSPEKLINENDLVAKTPQTTEVTTKILQKQTDFNVGNHSTSNNMYNAIVGPGGIPTRAFRRYGVPTIRSDLPSPCIKRVTDYKNYGDEAEMYDLLYPSLYSQHSVYDRDLLQPRTYDEIRAIFTNIGVRMIGDDLRKAYKMAAANHPNGLVSVETFKNILDEMQTNEIREGKHPLMLEKAKRN